MAVLSTVFTAIEDSGRRPRPGWRLAAYLAALVALFVPLALAGRSSKPANLAAHAALVVAVLGLTWAFRRFVDRRPWPGIGLRRPRWGEMLAGFAGGAGAIGAVLAVTLVLGWARVTGAEPGTVGAAASVVSGLFLYATSAFAQEVAFRGYAFQTLADAGTPGDGTLVDRRRVWRAAVVSSVLFAALHVSGMPTPLFVVVLLADVTLIACFFVLTKLSTGALWMAIAFHTAWNWTQDTVFSLDTDVGPDYGHALVHVRLGGPDLGLGHHGGVELLYLLTSALLFGGYWLGTRGRIGATR